MLSRLRIFKFLHPDTLLTREDRRRKQTAPKLALLNNMFSTSRKADAASPDESLDNWPIPHEPEKPWPEVSCFDNRAI